VQLRVSIFGPIKGSNFANKAEIRHVDLNRLEIKKEGA